MTRMIHPLEQLNGQMVTLAREYRGITQSALATACGVSQQAIARIEAGVTNAIGRDKVEKLAEVLSFPEEFFSLNEVRLGFGSSSYFYRKKITTAAERNKASIEGRYRFSIGPLPNNILLSRIIR